MFLTIRRSKEYNEQHKYNYNYGIGKYCNRIELYVKVGIGQ